ncbi:MAG: glycosyltransferase [Egibacteraceae bacterium]
MSSTARPDSNGPTTRIPAHSRSPTGSSCATGELTHTRASTCSSTPSPSCAAKASQLHRRSSARCPNRRSTPTPTTSSSAYRRRGSTRSCQRSPCGCETSSATLTSAVVVPSLTEPFGRIPMECYTHFHFQGAVVASTAGGLPETVAHEATGFAFDPGSAASLATPLERAITCPQATRHAMTTRAITLMRDGYAYENNVGRLIEHLAALTYGSACGQGFWREKPWPLD